MRLDFRCPRCQRLYPLPDYLCLGGWETYPELHGPDAAAHAPAWVVRRGGPAGTSAGVHVRGGTRPSAASGERGTDAPSRVTPEGDPSDNQGCQ